MLRSGRLRQHGARQNSPEEASKPQLPDGRKQHTVNEAVKKLTGDAAQDRIQKEIHLFNCACIIRRLLPSARVQGDSASIQYHVFSGFWRSHPRQGASYYLLHRPGQVWYFR